MSIRVENFNSNISTSKIDNNPVITFVNPKDYNLIDISVGKSVSQRFDETANYSPSGVWDFTGTLKYKGDTVAVWKDMPYATKDNIGGVQVIQSDTDFENGIRLNSSTKLLEIDPNYASTGNIGNMFEYVDNSGNPYIRAKLPLAGDYDIQAYTDNGQLPDDIWENMPYATEDSVGGVQVLQSSDSFKNGIRLNNSTKELEVDPSYASGAVWDEIEDKPSTATRWPEWDEVTSKPSTATRWPEWPEVTSKPSEFPPEDHTHPISDVNDLQSELDDKLDVVDFNDLFELKNDGSTDYIQAKYDFFGVGDIVAYSSADAEVEPIWSNMPYATTSEVGGVQVIQSDTSYENGIRLNATTKKLEIDPEYSNSFDESDDYSPSGIWDFTGTLNYDGNNVATESWVDDNYHPLGGSSSLNFEVEDLTIHGQVNQWNEEVITVDDASLQLNAIQDGARVESGIIIFDSDTSTELSKLYYDTDDQWKIDGDVIATENWVENNATAFDAVKLGGYDANDYPRRDVDEDISGEWTFNGRVNLKDIIYARSNHQLPISDITAIRDGSNKWNDPKNVNFYLQGENNAMVLSLGGWNDRDGMIQVGHADYADLLGELYLNPFGGNVGINTTNPQSKLDVNGDVKGDIFKGNKWQLRLDYSNYVHLSEIGKSSTIRFYPDNGDFWNKGNIENDGSITAGGDVTAYSDRRLKKNIRKLESSLDKVLQLNPVRYNRLESEDEKIGLIAQELREIYPEFVLGKETDDSYLSINYANIVSILIQAIKELNDKIDNKK